MAVTRVTVSVDAELFDRAKAAGLSPSAVFAEALALALGGRGKPKPPAERLDAVERQLAQLARRVGKLEGKQP